VTGLQACAKTLRRAHSGRCCDYSSGLINAHFVGGRIVANRGSLRVTDHAVSWHSHAISIVPPRKVRVQIDPYADRDVLEFA
jgi:hypothetical protein